LYFSLCPIIAPSGDRVHADVYNTGSGEYRVEWLPRASGKGTRTHNFTQIQNHQFPLLFCAVSYTNIIDIEVL